MYQIQSSIYSQIDKKDIDKLEKYKIHYVIKILHHWRSMIRWNITSLIKEITLFHLLQTAQGNRCSSIAHLGRKKRARKGKTSGSAKLRHPCKHRCHTPCCAPLTPLSLRLVLAKGVPARFFSQAFTQSSPAATLAPPQKKPSRFRLRSIVFNWGQPPLIVRLACGSRGRRAVIVFACYVSFFLFPPSIRGVAVFASLVPLSAQQPHLFNPTRAFLRSVITLRSFRLSSNRSATFPRYIKPSSDPTKKTTLHAKTPPDLLRLPPCSLRYATLCTPCQPPSLNSHRLRLTLRRQEKHSAIATPLFHRLRCSRLFSLTLGNEV